MKAISETITRTVARIVSLPSFVLLGTFTVLDLLFGFCHILHEKDILPSRFFHLGRDRGAAEIIQYIKFGLVIYILHRIYKATPSKMIAAWMILFGVMLVDDIVGIHEAVGGIILAHVDLPLPAGIRPKDVAEALVLALLEGSALAYVGFRYLQASRELKRYSNGMALALATLVVFGLLFDMSTLQWVEQGGEMAAMTILLGYVHWQWLKKPRI